MRKLRPRVSSKSGLRWQLSKQQRQNRKKAKFSQTFSTYGKCLPFVVLLWYFSKPSSFSVFIIILQKRKLRSRELKWLAGEWSVLQHDSCSFSPVPQSLELQGIHTSVVNQTNNDGIHTKCFMIVCCFSNVRPLLVYWLKYTLQYNQC